MHWKTFCLPAAASLKAGGLPLGLAHKVRLRHAVAAGQPVLILQGALDRQVSAFGHPRHEALVDAVHPSGEGRALSLVEALLGVERAGVDAAVGDVGPHAAAR